LRAVLLDGLFFFSARLKHPANIADCVSDLAGAGVPLESPIGLHAQDRAFRAFEKKCHCLATCQSLVGQVVPTRKGSVFAHAKSLFVRVCQHLTGRGWFAPVG